MSGGVDSSVAALICLEKGMKCEGVFLRLKDACSDSYDDTEERAAKAAAERLGIPLHVQNDSEVFEKKVLRYFAKSYLDGETPNPCVMCNREIKFGSLLDLAEKMNFDLLVTGHYVRKKYNDKSGRWEIYKARDPKKDQSYFLNRLSQRQLSKSFFPLGELTKNEVRKTAEQWGLPAAKKKDSQDVCFITNKGYVPVVELYSEAGSIPGNFVDSDGNILGRHRGIIHYTVGQRKGIGIAAGCPLFVSEIRAATNEIVLSPSEELFSKKIRVRDFNWISIAPPSSDINCDCKLRYSPKFSRCVLSPLEGNICELNFFDAQRAAAKGQSAVCYDGDLLLGGGIIDSIVE